MLNQSLKCSGCGVEGSFDYERSLQAYEPFTLVSLTAGFTHRNDEAAKTQRITCKCGEVIYSTRYLHRTKIGTRTLTHAI